MAAAADVVFLGRILTMNDHQPVAEAVAVTAGRITAVGSRDEVDLHIGPATTVRELGSSVLLPGFVEAHGHLVNEAIVLSDGIVDIRPVTVATADGVVELVRRTVAEQPDGAVLNGWDALLQRGLPDPSLAWLDAMAPDTSLKIVHNSGHAVYFNSVAAAELGLDRDTPDPVGASYGHTPDGELDGSAYEMAALMRVVGSALNPGSRLPEMLVAETHRLNAAGITTASELGFDPAFRPALRQIVDTGALTARIVLYERSGPHLASDIAPGWGDDLLRQPGIKTWADGSPWIGNIATSFPYLDNDQTRAIGLEPGHRGTANYTVTEFAGIAEAYFPSGWQLACHAHGDVAIDMVLDAWTELLDRYPRADHRLRLEHVGAMRPDQFTRAAQLGITCSMLINHLYYWGDVLADDLFGPEHADHWAAAKSAVDTGMRISLHNDGPVSPSEPLRNLTVATTRVSREGHLHGTAERLTIDQALRAQTIDAAYQLFCDDIVGSVEVGKYADLVVLSADPTTTAPADIADLQVQAVFLAGKSVHEQPPATPHPATSAAPAAAVTAAGS